MRIALGSCVIVIALGLAATGSRAQLVEVGIICGSSDPMRSESQSFIAPGSVAPEIRENGDECKTFGNVDRGKVRCRGRNRIIVASVNNPAHQTRHIVTYTIPDLVFERLDGSTDPITTRLLTEGIVSGDLGCDLAMLFPSVLVEWVNEPVAGDPGGAETVLEIPSVFGFDPALEPHESTAFTRIPGQVYQSALRIELVIFVVDTELCTSVMEAEFFLGGVPDAMGVAGPVFELPEGVTVNAPSINLVDNFIVPEAAACVPDFAEPAGSLDFNDVIGFLTAFGASDPSADLAPPAGVLDFNDIVEYLTLFAAGCP